MWISILAGLGATNILLLLIYFTGSIGIVFTWIPGRTIVVALSLLALESSQETENSMLNNIASHIIPVLFLIVFRIGIHNYQGRQPRFKSHTLWPIVWSIAMIVMVGALTVLWIIKSPIIFAIMGAFSILLNFANIQDVPEQIKTNTIKITWLYALIANVSAAIIIATISELINHKQQFIASIVSNIPFFSIVLLAQSTLTSVGTQITSQHIYMLAYQTWPSMTFMTICFWTRDFPTTTSICAASVATMVVIGLQFTAIMKKL
jgi:hypothetical protein